jgi:hypothetical protein
MLMQIPQAKDYSWLALPLIIFGIALASFATITGFPFETFASSSPSYGIFLAGIIGWGLIVIVPLVTRRYWYWLIVISALIALGLVAFLMSPPLP